jgi:hypothetical protein
MMLGIIRYRETSQAAVFTGSKQMNEDNLNNITCEASRNFRNRNGKRKYQKDKINEHALNKSKNMRPV